MDATAGTTRPRVLLADDHVGMLESVARAIGADFDVVAMVTGGRQALEASHRLEPDLIVLDITMPDLDGFGTARELKRMGSRAKIVFLSMHDGDEYMREAIACRANGYVLKTRVHADLVVALEHALAGSLFVPSVPSLAATDQCGHAAYFYTDDDVFVDVAARFLDAAIRQGDVIAVTLDEANRKAVAHRLQAWGWDPAQMKEQGRYLESDAADAVAQVIRDGRLDTNRLTEMIDGLERARLASGQGPQSRLTICGTMSVLLCQDGNVDAAIQLERTWDDLTRTGRFLTLCAYPLECLRPDATPDLFTDICSHHSVVSHAATA